MSAKQQIQLLDRLEFVFVEEGYLKLSLQMEEFSELNPCLRWQKISQLLQKEEVPERFACLQNSDPQWDRLRAALY